MGFQPPRLRLRILGLRRLGIVFQLNDGVGQCQSLEVTAFSDSLQPFSLVPAAAPRAIEMTGALTKKVPEALEKKLSRTWRMALQ